LGRWPLASPARSMPRCSLHPCWRSTMTIWPTGSTPIAPGRPPPSRNFLPTPSRALPETSSPLRPGSTIGILGGGQLGRMLALAGAKLGLKSHIYCPDPSSPAFDVTPFKTVAAYDDEAALRAFA